MNKKNTNSQNLGSIQVGEKFLCTKNVYIESTKEIAYTAGKVYECNTNGNLPDDLGHKTHIWFKGEYFYKHFTPYTKNAKYDFMKSVKENEHKSDEQSTPKPEKIYGFASLKKGDKIWRIKNNGEWEIIEFVCTLSNTDDKYAIFLDMNRDGLPKKYVNEFNESWFKYSDTNLCWAQIYEAQAEYYEKELQYAKDMVKKYKNQI
jgi:hypothetical protein